MKQGCKLKSVYIIAMLMMTAHLANAQPKEPISIRIDSDNLANPSVLLPGSKVVAGNSENDEFFILAEGEKPPVMVASSEIPQQMHPLEDKKMIRDFGKNPAKKGATSIKMASNKMKHPLLAQKKNAPKLVALNKKSGQKEEVLKIEKALTQALHHAQHQKEMRTLALNEKAKPTPKQKELNPKKLALNENAKPTPKQKEISPKKLALNAKAKPTPKQKELNAKKLATNAKAKPIPKQKELNAKKLAINAKAKPTPKKKEINAKKLTLNKKGKATQKQKEIATKNRVLDKNSRVTEVSILKLALDRAIAESVRQPERYERAKEIIKPPKMLAQVENKKSTKQLMAQRIFI